MKLELLGRRNVAYVWEKRKGSHISQRKQSPYSKCRGGNLMLWRHFLMLGTENGARKKNIRKILKYTLSGSSFCLPIWQQPKVYISSTEELPLEGKNGC